MKLRWFAGGMTMVAVASMLSTVSGCQTSHRPNEAINEMIRQNNADLAAGRFEAVEATSLRILALDLHEPQALFQLGLSRLCRDNDNGALDVWSNIDDPPPGTPAISDPAARRAIQDARRLTTALDAGEAIDRPALCRSSPLASAEAGAPADPAATAPTTTTPSAAMSGGASDTVAAAAPQRIRFALFNDEASFNKARTKDNRLNQEEELRDFLKSNSIAADGPMLEWGRIRAGRPGGGSFVIISSLSIPVGVCSTFVQTHCQATSCVCQTENDLGFTLPLSQ